MMIAGLTRTQVALHTIVKGGKENEDLLFSLFHSVGFGGT